MQLRLQLGFSRCLLLQNLLVGLSLVVTLATPASGRETYRALVVRMAQQAARSHLERDDLEMQLFRLTNVYRHSKGLGPLVIDRSNHDASVAHAMDMMAHNYMGHNASTGQDFGERMTALRDGAMVLPSMGENAARLSHADVNDSKAAQKIFEQWVNSSPHRHTLLSLDYLKLATGVVAQGDKIYADQIFVGPEVVTNMQRAVPQETGTLY